MLVLMLVLFNVACGGGEKPSETTKDLIVNNIKSLPTQSADCGNRISIGDIPVLKRTTFPFGCEPTLNNSVADKESRCTQLQFFSLIETFDPQRRDLNRDDGTDTRYNYFPITRSYLRNSSDYWHVYTEYAVDEIVTTNGGTNYTLPGSGRQFHTGEDWNLSTGADNGEHLYAIADGIVIFKDTGFGNTIEIVHKICPNENESHDDCELVISHYSHLSNNDWNLVNRGDRVNVGQMIARMGDTGSIGAPHLHFSIRRDSFLQRVNTDNQVDANGACVRLNPNQGVNTWPGLDAEFIRENYEDPTTFIKQNSGITLFKRHHLTDALSQPQRMILPQDGIVVVDLTYFPGDDVDIGDIKGDTRYSIVITQDSADGDQRLIGSARPLIRDEVGNIRAVIWGNRDTPLTAGTSLYIKTIVGQNGNDMNNTPYSISVSLYPYVVPSGQDGDHFLTKIKMFPSRDIFFDEGEAYDSGSSGDAGEVPQNKWYYNSVKSIYDLGIVGGYSNVIQGGCPEEAGQYCPENLINRAEFFQILMSSIAVIYNSSYSIPGGIPQDAWYQKVVTAAVELDILEEDNANSEWLSGNLLRREAARYIARAFNHEQDFTWRLSARLNMDNPFDDVARLDEDIPDILACYVHGIINGYSTDVADDPNCSAGDFCPNRQINRAEMARMIMSAIDSRLLNYIQ